MTVVMAMHQPNYVPWLGYFHKLARSDVFVHLDTVQFPRGRSFAARNRIKTPNGAAWLTIPVARPHGRDGRVAYDEVTFADPGWTEAHLRTIAMSYARAPHYDEIVELYREGLRAGQTLVDVNLALIESFSALLGIATAQRRLSDLLAEYGQKNELIAELCAAVGATAYLTGSGGGLDYTDSDLLAGRGIELQVDSYPVPEYPQLWGAFEPQLSILDALFNCGVDGCRELLSLTPSG